MNLLALKGGVSDPTANEPGLPWFNTPELVAGRRKAVSPYRRGWGRGGRV
jgi:hypothetical protein